CPSLARMFFGVREVLYQNSRTRKGGRLQSHGTIAVKLIAIGSARQSLFAIGMLSMDANLSEHIASAGGDHRACSRSGVAAGDIAGSMIPEDLNARLWDRERWPHTGAFKP